MNISNRTHWTNSNKLQEKNEENLGSQQNYCLLKFCNADFYNKIVNRQYILVNEREFIVPRVNCLLNKNKNGARACILRGILGSAKSACLNQVKNSLSKIKSETNKEDIKIIYLDMDRLSNDVWNEYNKNRSRYCYGGREKLIDKIIFLHINKDDFVDGLEECKTFNEMIDVSDTLKSQKKQIFFIDNLDKILANIYTHEKNKGKNKSDLIKDLRIIKLHIQRTYKDIAKLHSVLQDNEMGGCLVTARKETDILTELSNNVEYILDVDSWWKSNEDYLVAIFIQYIAKSDAKDTFSMGNQCKKCRYKLDEETYNFCKKFSDKDFDCKLYSDKNFKIIKSKLKNNLQIGDKNIKKFLLPFAYTKISNNTCSKMKKELIINNEISGYFKGRENNPYAAGTKCVSIIRGYFDLFPIYYDYEFDESILDTIESFVEKQYRRKSCKSKWVELICLDLNCEKDRGDSIFKYLTLSGILQKNERKKREPKYEVSEFFKFVYGNLILFKR